MEKKDRRSLSLFISIIIHLLLLVVLLLGDKAPLSKLSKKTEVEWVEITDLDQKFPLKQAQIVQQDDKSINDIVPEKDYKLSKNNQDVLKETKAAKNGEFKNRKNTQEGKKVAQKSAANKPQNKSKAFSLNDLKPKMFDNSFDQSKLAPAAQEAMSGSEVSQNDDYLKDVVAGAETLLKTREFVYYAYYNRIKRKLRQHWEPRIKKKIVKIMRKGRKIASTNDKITRLVITLDKGGDLVRIQVRNASGYNDLDDAAIEAFRAAAPFPNPPKGIVSTEGEVQINWDFVLET
ncbi:MAG: energy transducer TonB [Bdellovibrionales bacterium]|nr:energy transducer TonB [Bdellovibrionales bacterium]NQZ17979.1 energy transducer TonB [Bdellovibrionales bacterium]